MIEVQDVRKQFGGIKALDGVTAQFSTGLVYALVGPNGCGKTSLLNVIFGFYRPDGGATYWNDGKKRRLDGLSPSQRVHMGMGLAFQEPRGFSDFSVEENLTFGMMDWGSDNMLSKGLLDFPIDRMRGEIERLLESGGLAGSRKVRVVDLSYGQRKILDVLCLIARDCNVMLLDEPFAGLDPKNLARIVALLREAARQPVRTAIIVSHEIGVVSEVANEMLLMDHGRVVELGPPGSVVSSRSFREVYLG